MEDWNDPCNIDIENLIQIVGKHVESWTNVKDPTDASITKLSGLTNVTCLVKARDKSIQPRYVIFKAFKKGLCDRNLEGTVFKALSDQGKGPR